MSTVPEIPEVSDDTPPSPETRARRSLDERAGFPVTLADGNTWILPRRALYTRALDELRDKISDRIEFRNSVAVIDVLSAAALLLMMNYNLTYQEAARLLLNVDPHDIHEEVTSCLMGEADPKRSYTAWVRSGLLANRLKPEDVPPEDLPHVLRQLLKTGRIEPFDSFSAAAEGARLRAGLFQ